ncbi:MAG: hypothetical protein ABI557_08195 [Aureliella sp.]
MTGKSCQQVVRSAAGDYSGSNAEVYDKWSQAISSAHGLLDLADDDGQRTDVGSLVAILPILVVRDGTLWNANYDESGLRISAPAQIERIPFFIGAEIRPRAKIGESSLNVSHLEILTESGLTNFVSRLKSANPSETFFCLHPSGCVSKGPG